MVIRLRYMMKTWRLKKDMWPFITGLKWQYLDSTGKTITEAVYEDAGSLEMDWPLLQIICMGLSTRRRGANTV